MSLDTGKVIHSHDWRELPIDHFVINRVHDLALQEGQPVLVDGFPIFEYAPGIPVNDPEVSIPPNDAPPLILHENEVGEEDNNSFQSLDENQGAVMLPNFDDAAQFQDKNEIVMFST